jgi:UDP-N-acetylmuramoyl-tripeptide--D-alanyl-D-alanine ligase
MRGLDDASNIDENKSRQIESVLRELGSLKPTHGRGTGARLRHAEDDRMLLLIDESYNANPASMAAALQTMTLHHAFTGEACSGRLIAVLGDMLELGDQADQLHADLHDAIRTAKIDKVVACGPHMRKLYDVLPPELQAGWTPTSEGIRQTLLDLVQGGDVVMIKGSNGSKMGMLVAALKARHTAVEPED